MKENIENSIDDLLIRYLTGLASESEISEFENWLNSDKNNQEYFLKFKNVWELSSKLKDYREIDIESSLKKVKKRIDFTKGNVKIKQLWIFMRVAAVMIMFVGIYLIFKSKNSSIESIKMVKIETTNEQKIVILPDSSIVTLNLVSSIEYPEKFRGKERRVQFKGEAYFEVSHNKSKPFIIETNQSEIKVVGTAFSLKAIANAKTESIVVTEGLVLFSGKTAETNKPIGLKKGEKGILTPGQNLLEKEENKDLNFLSWKTGVFEFNNSSLTDALKLFSEFYHCHFEIVDASINSFKISGKYEKLQIEELIEVLELTLNVKIEKSGQSYLLKAAK